MNPWREKVALRELTNIGLGGPARFLAVVNSVGELKDVLSKARQENIPVHILGGGSNTVFADQGFAGLVIKIEIRGLQFKEVDGIVFLEAGAGENWDKLVAETVRRDLAGFECMSGIPGLVGATPMQNVGAYGQQVADVIESVLVLDRITQEEKVFKNEDCEFSYRDSIFKSRQIGRYIILAVTYRLLPGGAATIKYPQVQAAVGADAGLAEVREAVLNLRRRKSMVIDSADPHSRSCGSFFVNPVMSKERLETVREKYKQLGGQGEVPVFMEGSAVKIPAAWLVESAGFARGRRRGGVGISPNHALGLVNYSGTTVELLALAAEIQAGVKSKFDIELKFEPVVVS